MSGPSETGAAGGLAAQGQAFISISYGDPRPAVICIQQRCRWRTCSKPCSCAKKSPPASLLAALWTVKMPSSAPWRPAHLVAEAHADAKPKAYPRGHSSRPCRESAGHGLPACCPPGPCRSLSAPPRLRRRTRAASAGLAPWRRRLRPVQAGTPARAGAGPLPPPNQQHNASTEPNKREQQKRVAAACARFRRRPPPSTRSRTERRDPKQHPKKTFDKVRQRLRRRTQGCGAGKIGHYVTRGSREIPHRSTNLAQCRLASGIGRDLAFSAWYALSMVGMQAIKDI